MKHFALPPDFGNRPAPKTPGVLKVLFPSGRKYLVKNYGLFQAVCEELERRGNKIEKVYLEDIDRTRIPEIFWSSDIMLLTSLSEGSPTVIKEAIAAKLPFVSVDVGDVKEWVKLVEFGVVMLDREPTTIADAMATILGRVKQRSLLDNSKCLEAMDVANAARRVRLVYDQMLETGHGK